MRKGEENTMEEDDSQFLKDLEEAKKQSLESYNSECFRMKNKSPFSAAPFSSSRSSGMVHQTTPPPPPIGFISTSTQQFSPITQNSTFQGPTTFPVPFSSSNIRPSTPFSSEPSRQPFPFSRDNGRTIGPGIGFLPYGPYQFGASGAGPSINHSSDLSSPNASFANSLHVVRRQSLPPTSASSVLSDTQRYNSSCSNAAELPSLRKLSNGSLYKGLRSQVNSLKDDLIDLGQDDGRNVLEAFDPLFDQPNPKEEPPQRVHVMTTLPFPKQISQEVESMPFEDSFTPDVTDEPNDADEQMEYKDDDQSLRHSSIYPTLDSIREVESQSLYEAYPQLDYLYHVSISSESSSFYWQPSDAVSQSSGNAPTPSRSSFDPNYIRVGKRGSSDKVKRRGKLYEDITSLKKVAQNDSELIAFVDMLQRLKRSVRTSKSRDKYSYIMSSTGPSNSWEKGLSLKLVVWNEDFRTDPVSFTSDVTAIVELTIEQALTKMENSGSVGTGGSYLFRVKGLDEYLDSSLTLIDHRYVQECIKFDEDVRLVLVARSSLARGTWALPHADDITEASIQPEEITPTWQSRVITFAEISKFLEVIDSESDKLSEKLSDKRASVGTSINPTPLIQTVKGICVLLGDVQTVEIRRSLKEFVKACETWNFEVQKQSAGQSPQSKRTIIGDDSGSRHSYVEIIKEDKSALEVPKDSVLRTKENVIESVRNLVEMYSKSFPVSFQMNSPLETSTIDSDKGPKTMSEMLDPFVIRVSALHRIKSEWITTYVDFFVGIEVFHGTRFMFKQTSPTAQATKMDDRLFFNTVIFDVWLDFEHLPMCILPKESRLVFSIYGRKLSEGSDETHEAVELGWASIQCFDFQGYLVKGNQLLPLWPVGMAQKRLGPAPNSVFSYDLNVPLITIEFPDFGPSLKFPDIPPSNHTIARDFDSLDKHTQVLLKNIIENSTFTRFSADDRETLWEKRKYLHTFPSALPKVLLAAQYWDYASLSELHKMLDKWASLSPLDALELLLPCFPDRTVRQTAIAWIGRMRDENLITILPQLVEALSYETFDLSPLAEFLLKRSLLNFELAHALFWSLVSEVGLGKWGLESEVCTVQFMSPCASEDQTDPRRRRLELMRNSLMVISHHKWKAALINEFKLMQGLRDVTTIVKLAHPSQRTSTMSQELKRMDIKLFEGIVYSLPLSPSYIVTSLDVESCICYNSASVPLKVNFRSALPEGGIIPVLFKQGDDIRQDMLTIQVIRMIEMWWLTDGLDLRVVTFTCVPTGFKQGIVEIVSDAETLCKIQADYGLTGAFRNRPISEWLAKMNPSTLDYRRAVDNFTRSCAAYCVLTYILGICDRHNDNIMLTAKGHLFHIDFGKFLGDAQMFGSFKRDRAPFVLTSDMLFVINEGEKVSQRFHDFVELCCEAFGIVRRHGNILMNLFAMMATAGIPGVDIKSVAYIQNALLPECTNVEAAAKFTRFIEDSMRNWFTNVNFFIHSLAQLRFTSSDPTDNPATLSFMPKMYSMDSDGRIQSAVITGFKKKYDPEKYYSYSIRVKRKDHTEPSQVHRSYKQFFELYTKLCLNFPMAVKSLREIPKSSGIGRSNIKQVAERRKVILQSFLDSLFSLADEISHSDLVYTFFHPLLKDEEYHDQADVRDGSSLLSPVKIHGGIKVSIEYTKEALMVLVRHAFDLACPNGEPPSAYVKSYLQPDPQRLTKQKTGVVRRSQHPTFMELIEYRMPLDVIVKRVLQLSVWHHDPLQENNFLGGVSIPLRELSLETETTQVYLLGNLTLST